MLVPMTKDPMPIRLAPKIITSFYGPKLVSSRNPNQNAPNPGVPDPDHDHVKRLIAHVRTFIGISFSGDPPARGKAQIGWETFVLFLFGKARARLGSVGDGGLVAVKARGRGRVERSEVTGL